MSDREQAYKGLSLTVNGFGFLGSLTEFDPPEVNEMTESYRGGRAAPTKVMVGYDEVEAKVKLSRDDFNMTALRAIVGRDVAMTVRASTDEKGKTIETRWDIYGRIYSVETATVKAGSLIDKTYNVTVEKFVKSIGGVPVEAFDLASGELKFGTTDVLADVKSQVGL